jgi:hypothetical protein
VSLGCSNSAPQQSSAPPSKPVSVNLLAPDLPPLPGDVSTAVRPPEVVRAVYEFAARHPEVLNYVPCFCGCDRGGHRGNHDCFVSGRSDKGQVTSWEPHGMVCEVCLDVGMTALQMHTSGASLGAIRDVVETRYASYPGHTPTPPPPGPATGASHR